MVDKSIDINSILLNSFLNNTFITLKKLLKDNISINSSQPYNKIKMSKEEAKQIANLTKQNEGMEASFKTKGIPFTKLSIDSVDPETELLMLQNQNKYLKEISLANRPVKVKEEKTPVKEQIKVEKIEEDNDEKI